MKKLLFSILLITFFSLTYQEAKAQAWDRHSKVLALGFGASQFYHIDNYYYYGNARRFQNWYSPVTGQLNFQGEFGIHKYVGIGFTAGIGGRGELPYGYAGELNIPMGMIVNFHFYQLIADHAKRKIHADKLDIYAGLSFGSGLAFTFYSNTRRIVPLAFGGPHVGIRYYFSPKVGLNAELGFGQSIANLGFVFKL